MLSEVEVSIIAIFLEGFLFGLYSGIFAVYLQCPSNNSKTAIIISYVVCLLYVLSTATLFIDVLTLIFETRTIDATSQLLIDSFRLLIIQVLVNSLADFIAQSILIYRCWIVWGQNIYVIIIPAFLAITYFATWLSTEGATILVQGNFVSAPWGTPLIQTDLVTSMAVNALVTGLMVFKILKVFLEVKATTAELLTLGSLNSAIGGNKLRQVLFIIIESGMALFAIQLVRVVISSLPMVVVTRTTAIATALNYVIVINEMLNGIAPTIILVRVSMRLSFTDEESFKQGAGSLRFYNTPSDLGPSTSRGEGSGTPPQQRSDID